MRATLRSREAHLRDRSGNDRSVNVGFVTSTATAQRAIAEAIRSSSARRRAARIAIATTPRRMSSPVWRSVRAALMALYLSRSSPSAFERARRESASAFSFASSASRVLTLAASASATASRARLVAAARLFLSSLISEASPSARREIDEPSSTVPRRVALSTAAARRRCTGAAAQQSLLLYYTRIYQAR